MSPNNRWTGGWTRLFATAADDSTILVNHKPPAYTGLAPTSVKFDVAELIQQHGEHGTITECDRFKDFLKERFRSPATHRNLLCASHGRG